LFFFFPAFASLFKRGGPLLRGRPKRSLPPPFLGYVPSFSSPPFPLPLSAPRLLSPVPPRAFLFSVPDSSCSAADLLHFSRPPLFFRGNRVPPGPPLELLCFPPSFSPFSRDTRFRVMRWPSLPLFSSSRFGFLSTYRRLPLLCFKKLIFGLNRRLPLPCPLFSPPSRPCFLRAPSSSAFLECEGAIWKAVLHQPFSFWPPCGVSYLPPAFLTVPRLF